MGSEGRVMVVKFPYSSMKTVPKVDTMNSDTDTNFTIIAGGAGPYQVSFLQSSQADERVSHPVAAGEEEGSVLCPPL